MVTDPIADLLTRIRNAVRAKHSKTTVPFSRTKLAIVEVLKKSKFVEGYDVQKTGAFQEIVIHLSSEHPSLNLKRISKPGQRIYIGRNQIKPVLNGYGIGVISTPQGIMTTGQARKSNLGGELICEVW